MLRQSCSINPQRSLTMRRLSGIARPRSGSGNGTGRLTRAATSFWPKNQDTRAACSALKASLSRADGIANRTYRASVGLQGPLQLILPRLGVPPIIRLERSDDPPRWREVTPPL